MDPNNVPDPAPNATPQRNPPASIVDIPVDLLPNIFQGTDIIDQINASSVHPAAAELPRFLPSEIGHIFIVHHVTGLYYIVWETMKINFEVDEEKYNQEYLRSGRTRMIRDVCVGFHTEPGRLRNRDAKFDFIVCKTRDEREKVFRYVVELVHLLTRETTSIEFHSAEPTGRNFFYIFGIIPRFHRVHIFIPRDMNSDDLRVLLEDSSIHDLCLNGTIRNANLYNGAIKPVSLGVTDGYWISAQSLLCMETKYFFADNTQLTGRDIKDFLEAWKTGRRQNVTTMCCTKNAPIRNYNSVIVHGLDAELWHVPFVRNDVNRSVFQPNSTWCMRNEDDVLAMVGITPNKIEFRVWNFL